MYELSNDQMLVFFDVESHDQDTRGIEVASLDAAEAAAVTGLGIIVSDLDWHMQPSLSVDVRSADGELLSKIKLTITIDRQKAIVSPRSDLGSSREYKAEPIRS